MSVRNAIVSLLSFSTLLFLAACGGGNGGSITNPTAPPSGGFSDSNLNGSYVFTSSGTDVNGAPYAIVGAFTANGSGGITAGTLDINDAAFSAAVPNSPISTSSSYSITADGRGEIKLGTSLSGALSGMFGTITLDFALQSNSHGVVIELDSNATGSGTLDSQATGVTPTGSYAFSFSGADTTSGAVVPFATVGNFTLGSGGAISAGLEDFNDGSFAYTNDTLTGTVGLGPSSTAPAALTTAQYPSGQTYDVYAIDATHLKFIELDPSLTLSGDAFAQTTTTVPTGTLAYTMEGIYPSSSESDSAGGGFMVTDGAGNITASSNADVNNGGSVSPSPITFSGTYTAAGTGRFTLALTTFPQGTSYVAYPSSGGLLLLETDNSGIMAGAAFAQTSTSFAAGQGYGLNLTGENISALAEVDDIAEFTANSSGATVVGVIDENSTVQSSFGLALNGTYSAPDTSGRGSISATAGTNSSNTTLNGGFALTFYTVDGTTFPFIETDSGQVSVGVFSEQSATTSTPAIAKSHTMFVPRPLVKPRASLKKKN